eukprot:364333-Chlamydomonas_euryale.AAC.2
MPRPSAWSIDKELPCPAGCLAGRRPPSCRGPLATRLATPTRSWCTCCAPRAAASDSAWRRRCWRCRATSLSHATATGRRSGAWSGEVGGQGGGEWMEGRAKLSVTFGVLGGCHRDPCGGSRLEERGGEGRHARAPLWIRGGGAGW